MGRKKKIDEIRKGNYEEKNQKNQSDEREKKRNDWWE